MEINRVDFLKRLLAVSPGLTTTDTIKQSSCLVFRKGRVYSMNREVACAVKSGLDEEFYGAIAAKRLIELMKKLSDEFLDVEIVNKTFTIKGLKRRSETKLVMEEEVFLPVESVELPKEWTRLKKGFADAVDLVRRCTKKDKGEPGFGKACVHIHPEWLEASDNTKMARWTITTFVADSVLVRGSTLREIVPLGMTKGAETPNWLHFRNPYGLRVSLKKWPATNYPDWSEYLKIRGKKAVFPKVLSEAADRAGLLLDTVDGSVKVSISKEGTTVSALGTAGSHTEPWELVYEGEPMRFLIPPKLIADLVDKQSNCEVSPSCLRVAGEHFVYLTSLEIEV